MIQQLIRQNQLLLRTNQELGENNSHWLSKIWETQQKMMLHKEEIPPRILFQQPVKLLNACGYVSPIYLDLIDSLEAFITVVKVKFKQRGVSSKGLSKVDNGEFVLRVGQKEVSLNQEWQALFRPGQTVTMSMIFYSKSFSATHRCFGCHSNIDSVLSDEIEWYGSIPMLVFSIQGADS
jgi:hypothetical protein